MMAKNEGVQSLAHLVSYMSDSDEEKARDDEEEEEEGEVKENEMEMETIEEEPVEVFEQTEIMPPMMPSGSKMSLVSYFSVDEESGRRAGLVSYDGGEEEDGRKADQTAGGDEDQDVSWSEAQLSPSDDLEDRVKVENVKHLDSSYPTASMSLPESALSQKIRRLSAEEVTLPPEPPGRCSRHLQEKFNSYYKKNLNLNQIIQRRKDFRNPSIYEKLINYIGVDELGTNYPKDMYDPYSWDESSYYEALAKTQREEIQKKKEKDKKEKTKVEFVTGVARKPQIQAPLITSTTGTTASTSTTQGTGHEEKKRKSKWDNPTQPPPPPLPLMQRPLISLLTTTITAPTVVSTTTSATGSKTTVISSIGTIKKPKLDK